jgi:hypothetical protein
VELFYTTELAEQAAWQRAATVGYDLALPEAGESGEIATAMSWRRDNQLFTIVLLERYGQYVLISLLQSSPEAS